MLARLAASAEECRCRRACWSSPSPPRSGGHRRRVSRRCVRQPVRPRRFGGLDPAEFALLGIDRREAHRTLHRSHQTDHPTVVGGVGELRRPLLPGRGPVAGSASGAEAPGRHSGSAPARSGRSSGPPTWPDTAIGDTWVASSHSPTPRSLSGRRLSPRGWKRWASRSLPTSAVAQHRCRGGPRDRGARGGPHLQASYRVFDRWGLFTDVIGDPSAARGIPELLAGRVIIGSR